MTYFDTNQVAWFPLSSTDGVDYNPTASRLTDLIKHWFSFLCEGLILFPKMQVSNNNNKKRDHKNQYA